MPTTLLGLLLFLVLLVPGFVYTVRRERRVSSRSVTALRELVSLAFVSVLADLAVLIAFSLLRAAAPGWTPDVGAIVADPSSYFAGHYTEVFVWGVGMLAAATIIAALAAGDLPRRAACRFPVLRERVPHREHDAHISAWTLLFTEKPNHAIHLGCLLTDGSYLTGRLFSFSRAAEDTEDRELTLSAPIAYRKPGETELFRLPDVHKAAVSARQLALLTVTYVPNRPAQPAESATG